MFSEVEPEIHGFLEFLDLSAELQQRCPKWVLKGVCHQIFDLAFFHASNQSMPLKNMPNYFRI